MSLENIAFLTGLSFFAIATMFKVIGEWPQTYAEEGAFDETTQGE